jgi:hypothetical protein
MDIENTYACKHEVVGFCNTCQEEFKGEYFRHYTESSFEKEIETKNFIFSVEFLRET